MSNLETAPEPRVVGGLTEVSAKPVHELYDGRLVSLGGSTEVRRLLPNLGRRLIGAWCFVDHYGPDDITKTPGMQVPPHPHLGLQTVSWLLDGEVHHRDSLGNSVVIRPGGLGLLTAGRGIAHAEQSPASHPAYLHGAQLWIALPDGARNAAPAWQHEPTVPVVTAAGLAATVLIGDLDGATSPGRVHSPLVGVDVEVDPGADVRLPVTPDFEYAAFVTANLAEVDGARLEPGRMLYLGCGRHDLRITSRTGARLLLLGGVPFEEEIVMWWNFVARSGDEIRQARDEWAAGERFGEVTGYDGPRQAAPEPPAGRLLPGGRIRHRRQA